MTQYVFSGKAFAAEKEIELKRRVENLVQKGKTPKLAIILSGDDPASKLYVNLKGKAAERVGVGFELLQPVKAEKEEIIGLIKQLKKDDTVTGIIVQLPLPGELDTKEATSEVVKTISPEKDIDGLTDAGTFTSATVKAVLYIVKTSQRLGFLPQDLKNTNICVVGGTGIVGSGIVKELQMFSENILVVNSKTLNSKKLTTQAELIISAVGIPGLIKKDMVKEGAVVIDVGSPKGDFTEDVQDVASFVTPVPGGVGPVTVACVIENTVEAAERY